jgi:glutathione S-transferase
MSDSPNAAYRIFGSELSPYSIKVRSYFRYKAIPHEWINRSQDTMEEFKKYAKLPLIPAVATPEGEGLQDSTPIIEKMEVKFPEPSIHPADPALAFLSALIEEFGDEWGNKWMFHYRWAREVDQQSVGPRLAKSMMPELEGEALDGMAGGIVKRMVGRVWFVGSSEQTAPQIEASFAEGVELIEAHLSTRPYLFGARPAFADFGLWGQIYNAWTDPTAGEILRKNAPHTCEWIQRMLDPKAEGDFESWDTLGATLEPFLTRSVGALFLPWSDANSKALAAGEEEYTVELDGKAWTQKPQKYHARSLAKIRQKHTEVAGNADLDAILERSGCLEWLREA